MAQPKKSQKITFNQYQERIRKICNCFSQKEKTGILFFWGPSDYLLYQACLELKNCWIKNRGGNVRVLEKKDLESFDSIQSLWQQTSLFEGQPMYQLRRMEKDTSFLRRLTPLSESTITPFPLVVSYQSDTLANSLNRELNRIGAIETPCFAPSSWEIPDLIEHLCRKLDLTFDQQARSLIQNWIGDDLFILDNELRKLALIFPNSPKPLSTQDIAPHLGVLRQDQAFELTNLIMHGHTGHALVLSHDLSQRGESDLSILGILLWHTRTALNIKNNSPREHTLRLPSNVHKRYTNYCQQRSEDTLLKALHLCHQAQIHIKSSRLLAGHFWIDEIILMLSG